MGRWLAVASACTLVAAPAAVANWPSAETVEPRVDRLFSEYDRPNGPGCAVGVYNVGRTLFAKGYGQADIAARRPITPKSVFNIASMTKQFTAFAIALLESEGKVSFDAPVRQYVPELPEFGSPVTVRHLIHHTSGLRDFGALMELRGWQLDQEFSRAALLKLLARQRELNFAPGTSHEYGNTNYALLGIIIERVSGRPYGDFLAERIFRPLGMAGSGYREKAPVTVTLAYNYAPSDHGHFINHVWARANVPGFANVYSSIEDLARWDGNFFRTRVGDRSLIQRIYLPGRLISGEQTGYAYGLYSGTYRGLKTIEHGGLGGGSFHLVRFPDEQLSVAALCNEYGVGPKAPNSFALSHSVADLFLPRPGPGSRVPKAEVAAPPIAMSRAELEKYVGDYWVADEGTPISLRLTDSGLAELYGGKFYPLVPVGPGLFRDKENPAVYRFSGPNRSVLTYDEPANDFSRRGERRAAWSPAPHDLHSLAGRYCSSEVDVCWSIERSGAQLWLVRAGFPRQVLNPAFADTFQLVENHWIGARNVRITLERHGQSGFSGFRVSRGRVRNLLFEPAP